MSVSYVFALTGASVVLATIVAGPVSAQGTDGVVASPDSGVLAPDAPAPKVRRRRKVEPTEAVMTGDLPGRYAVVRDKRDTGCMLTLDRGRVKGGARAQLAPGCRDQGIVIFDPASWAMIKGSLVLTARAGHKAMLQKKAEGVWTKDPNAAGKPLGLKKL